jgi:hypothetical protein
MGRRTVWVLAVIAPVGACGGSSNERGDATADGDVTGISSITADDAPQPTSAGESGSASAEVTGDAGTSSIDESDAADDAPKFDLGDYDVGGSEGCECGNQMGFSYIWIANSSEGTVSKINTETLVEEGRYRTRSDFGDPSRTSVSIDGRAVVVANRNGGVVKVWAEAEFCDPNVNGMAGVQTSSGAADILPWGQDDCVAWFAPFAYTTQRPVAWHPGTQNRATCEYDNQEVWTSGCAFPQPNIMVHLLDGDTGIVIDETEVGGFPCSGFGAYGGAIDGNGDFWISENAANARLARITHDTLDTQVWQAPIMGYGMTVDSNGRPWIAAHYGDVSTAAAARFDPLTETWALAENHSVKTWSGMAEDGMGRIWMNYTTFDGVAGGGIVPIDRDTLQVGAPVDIAAISQYPPDWMNGISIDMAGNVWSVSPSLNTAFRYDPDTAQLDTVGGLVFPYTYSDMTGSGIQTNECGPAG